MVVIIIIPVLPLTVLTCAKCCKGKMNKKIKAFKKLIEVQKVLLHDLSTMIATCDEGGQGE